MIQKIKNYYHFLEARIANEMYRYPSKNLTVIAVTGTDGKTTTSSLIYHILKSSGKKVALISTVGVFVGEKQFDLGFHVTTPSAFSLQKHIKMIVKEFEEQRGFLVLEVTSHAIDQFRTHGIAFDIGVLTNVTHEHLDYHKTYENYLKTKAKLLINSKIAVVNRDDESYKRIMNYELRIKNKKMITFGLNSDADTSPIVFPFKTSLHGEFNVYNCLAAIAVCKELGLNSDLIRGGIKTFKPPVGRQEIIYSDGFTVMIDFAHTPNALASLLPGIRKICKGRLIHVFGAAGERDTSKRPYMGKASSQHTDIIILTAEDPRGEEVERINQEIYSQIPKNKFQILNNFQIQNLKFSKGEKYVISIPDRKEAIEFALSLARKDDWVVLTGKGHENSMNYGDGEIPWSEHTVILEALKKKTHDNI